MSIKQQNYALKTFDAYHKTPFFLSPQPLVETTWPNVIWPAHGMELTDPKLLDNLPVSMRRMVNISNWLNVNLQDRPVARVDKFFQPV